MEEQNAEKTLGAQAMDILTEMCEKGQLCDGVLRTEDGAVISVHRSIMAACSPYFRVLFTSSLNSNNRYDVLIPGVSGDMLGLIVDYAYTRVTHVTEENVSEVLPAADQFNITGMVNDCCSFISSNMTAENCIGIRKFARDYWCPELEREAHRFLMKNFIEIANTSEELLLLPIDEVIEVINAEDLNISNEEVAWDAVIKWISFDPDNRQRFIVDLMRCVRLGLLDTHYFMEKVKVHEYVDKNEMCKPIVIETLKFLYDLEMITQRTGEVPTPELARPRVPHEIMFAIGGWSGNSPTSIIETYDTRADRWITVPEVDPAGPRAYHKCAVVGFDIFIIGGFDGVEYFNSCRCFNAVTKEWREVAPMHSRRCYVSIAVVNEIIYVMGGYNGQHRQNTAEKYDHTTNQWSFIAPMNVQRSDACASTLNGCICITGGFSGTECLSSCESYNPEVNQWTIIAPMRNRRSGVSCISHHGHVFALGGFNGLTRLRNGEKYDPYSDTWQSIPDMFNPRSNFPIEVMDEMIFAVGGFNGVSTIYHVECYDERTNEWYEATDMNAFRSALAACVIADLPNIRDYIHKNRDRLMEEKRQKLLQMQQHQDENNNDDDNPSNAPE